MQNSQAQRDDDLGLANLNATIANLSVNLIILAHIQRQIALQEQAMADNAKFNRELFQMLETIIKNQ